MNKQELEKRTQIITSLLAIYDKAGDKNMIVSYVELLKDIPVDVLKTACRKISLESEHRPTPAVIVKAAHSIVEQATGTGSPSWEDAWREIEKEMHDTFVYGKPQFSHKEIEDAVNAFGWEELCAVLTKDLPIVRAQLRDMYKSICERRKEQHINAYVLGGAVLIDTEKEVRLKLK